MVLVYKDMHITNARGYPEVKSEGFKGNFVFYFGSEGRNKSRFGFKSLRDTHVTRATTG